MITVKEFFEICGNGFHAIQVSYFDKGNNYSFQEYREEEEVLEKYGAAFVSEFTVDTDYMEGTHTLDLTLLEETREE